MDNQRRPAELVWVLRPAPARPAHIRALTGGRIHAVGAVGPDGQAEVVLRDGTRVPATPAEIVAEEEPPPTER